MDFTKKATRKKHQAATALAPKITKKMQVTVVKIIVMAVIAVMIIGVCGFCGVIKGVIDSAPDISTIDVAPSGFTTNIYDSAGNPTITLVSEGANRVYVTMDKIPDYLAKAFVAIEDERFYEHKGIDTKGIIRAMYVGLSSGGHFSEGASTITQQLLKNNIFTDWVNQTDFLVKLKRKIQEQYLAVQLEKKMDKNEILENYLNTINLGQNTLGVQAASKRYFNKDVSQLTISEATVIAAITQNPSGNNPIKHPENNAKRREKVLGNMLEHGWITQEEYNEAAADDVYVRIQNVNDEIEDATVYSYFIDEMISQVIDALMEEKGYTETQAYNALYRGGLQIYTTQDMALQQICDEEFANSDNFPSGSQVSLTYRLTLTHADGSVDNYSEQSMQKYYREQGDEDFSLIFSSEDAAREKTEAYKLALVKDGDTVQELFNCTMQPQASCVLMDPHTGQVKAIVGGRGAKTASLTLNRATGTTRQPGSTFKILSTYAPALEECGKTLATTYVDEPYNYSNGRPVKNAGGGHSGTMTIRRAITKSTNVVAVKCLTEISPQLGYDYLHKFGFTTLVDTDIVQSLALGGITNGVTNLELTAAYAAIANKGVYIKPIFFTKIIDHDGNVLIDNSPQETRVIKESTAYLLTSAMQDVLSSEAGGTGAGANFGTMPIAGKTGTTSETYDLWFAAYTPYYICTVWGGYDVNTTLPNTRYHRTLWRRIMERVHENLEYKEFEMPESVVKTEVCTSTGLLARGGCPSRTEYFTEGTEPTSYCTWHYGSKSSNSEDDSESRAEGESHGSHEEGGASESGGSESQSGGGSSESGSGSQSDGGSSESGSESQSGGGSSESGSETQSGGEASGSGNGSSESGGGSSESGGESQSGGEGGGSSGSGGE